MKKFNVIKVIKGKVFLGDEVISPAEIKVLWDEIKSFRQFRLRSLFYESLKQYAIEEGFEGSTSWDNTLHFRGMLDGIERMKGIETLIEKLMSPIVMKKSDKDPTKPKLLML